MIGLLLITHAQLGQEFIRALEHVTGPQQAIDWISLSGDEDMVKARETIIDKIASLNHGQGVIVLTDMFGGTPSNLAISLMSKDVEVLAGVNLPMLIKLAQIRSTETMPRAVAAAQEAGRKYINVASKLLEGA